MTLFQRRNRLSQIAEDVSQIKGDVGEIKQDQDALAKEIRTRQRAILERLERLEAEANVLTRNYGD